MKSIKKIGNTKKISWALELSETEIQQNDVKGAQLGSQSQLAQFFNTKSNMGQLPTVSCQGTVVNKKAYTMKYVKVAILVAKHARPCNKNKF